MILTTAIDFDIKKVIALIIRAQQGQTERLQVFFKLLLGNSFRLGKRAHLSFDRRYFLYNGNRYTFRASVL